jgi:hypothetical protein
MVGLEILDSPDLLIFPPTGKSVIFSLVDGLGRWAVTGEYFHDWFGIGPLILS